VLLLELWFEYRRDFVAWVKTERGFKRAMYYVFTLGVVDVSEKALRLDDRVGWAITIIGIPSAFLLHGYVGFIFGSVKANPWWGTVLMPIIFIFSAIVSGIALLIPLYVIVSRIHKMPVDMTCLSTIGKYLLLALVVDAAIESLDWIHRLYEAEESIDVLVLLASGKLFFSFLLLQVFLGTLVPLGLLSLAATFNQISGPVRRWLYLGSSALILIGVFAMRWNVVIGGQLFSKSLRGFTVHKLELAGQEGLFTAIVLLVLPFVILSVLVKFFLPVKLAEQQNHQAVPAAFVAPIEA
jgi:Ni/Fe-hydrogenase subunit HybB-like protein